MKDMKEIDTKQIDSEKWYRIEEVANILSKTTQNIWYLIKEKYFKETRVVSWTPKRKRTVVKWQSIIDFVDSLNQ